MPRTRGTALALLFCSIVLVPACGDDPPDKEIQQAQTAIDSAKAAGANDYAHDEFAGAEDALKRAREAVAERDYRLALTNAIDSRERAVAAAAQAGDQKNVARNDAGRLMAGTLNALAEANATLKAAEAARVTAKSLKGARAVIADVDQAVQKAGAAFQREQYLSVKTILDGTTARLSNVTRDLSQPAAKPSRRRR